MIAISSNERLGLTALLQRLRQQMAPILHSHPVQLAYLYGSAAADSTTPLSDVDIALVAEGTLTPIEELDLELEVQVELAQRAGLRNADVRVLNHCPLLLRGQVLAHSILLYARNQDFRIAFETRTRDAYFDFKPLADAEGNSFFSSIRARRHRMVNREKVEGLIRQQQGYLKYLRVLAQVDEERFLSDPDKTGAAKYYLLVAIETCIDICNHVISAQNFRAPIDYADIFEVLSEEKIFPEEFARTLRKMAGFRNRLVHVYAGVDNRVVYEYLGTRLGDFDQFQEYISKFIS